MEVVYHDDGRRAYKMRSMADLAQVFCETENVEAKASLMATLSRRLLELSEGSQKTADFELYWLAPLGMPEPEKCSLEKFQERHDFAPILAESVWLSDLTDSEKDDVMMVTRKAYETQDFSDHPSISCSFHHLDCVGLCTSIASERERLMGLINRVKSFGQKSVWFYYLNKYFFAEKLLKALFELPYGLLDKELWWLMKVVQHAESVGDYTDNADIGACFDWYARTSEYANEIGEPHRADEFMKIILKVHEE